MTNRHIHAAKKWAKSITSEQFKTLPLHLQIQVTQLANE